MSKKKLFTGFTPEEQKENERLARLQYGPDLVNESVKRWNGYGKARQDDILRENGQVYTELAAALEAGKSANSPEVQELMQRWHDGIRYFYEPTLEILRGLGDLYQTPEFAVNIGQFHPDLPAYMREAITVYVDELEYAEIERMLAEDEAKKSGL